MATSWIVLAYLLVRIFSDVFKLGSMKLNLGQILASFGLLIFMVILVFVEIEVLGDILSRGFSKTFSIFFITIGFVFGFESSNIVFKMFYKDRHGIFYFYNSIFALVFLILATFLIIFA